MGKSENLVSVKKSLSLSVPCGPTGLRADSPVADSSQDPDSSPCGSRGDDTQWIQSWLPTQPKHFANVGQKRGHGRPGLRTICRKTPGVLGWRPSSWPLQKCMVQRSAEGAASGRDRCIFARSPYESRGEEREVIDRTALEEDHRGSFRDCHSRAQYSRRVTERR